MNFKRIISAVLLLSAIFALTACGEPDYSEYRTDDNLIGKEEYSGKELSAYLFKPEDADARLEIVNAEKDKVVQYVDFPENGEYYALFEMEFALPGATFQDMNFDGYKDLYIPCCAVTANLEGMAWLWDKNEGEFVLCEELCKVYELTVDAEKKIIVGTDYASKDGILRTEYKWEEGKLVKADEYIVNN